MSPLTTRVGSLGMAAELDDIGQKLTGIAYFTKKDNRALQVGPGQLLDFQLDMSPKRAGRGNDGLRALEKILCIFCMKNI